MLTLSFTQKVVHWCSPVHNLAKQYVISLFFFFDLCLSHIRDQFVVTCQGIIAPFWALDDPSSTLTVQYYSPRLEENRIKTDTSMNGTNWNQAIGKHFICYSGNVSYIGSTHQMYQWHTLWDQVATYTYTPTPTRYEYDWLSSISLIQNLITCFGWLPCLPMAFSRAKLKSLKGLTSILQMCFKRFTSLFAPIWESIYVQHLAAIV
jgi:hypothetical protein